MMNNFDEVFMKTKLFLIFLLSIFFSACASTPRYYSTDIVEVEYDSPESGKTGVLLKLVTDRYYYANKELFIMAKKAQELGYKYFVIVSYSNDEYVSSYYATVDYYLNTITLTPRTNYVGGGGIYAFNDIRDGDSWRVNMGRKFQSVDVWVNAGISAGLFPPPESNTLEDNK